MGKFFIKDVDGNILFEVDTAIYPNAKPHNCKIKDPANNIITQYKGHYFIAKRRRNGTIVEPIVWMAITHEYFDMFFKCGSGLISPPLSLINSIEMEVDSYGKKNNN